MSEAGGIQGVVLASGGLDSCVAAAEAASRHGAEGIALLHVRYGQRTAAREERAFQAIADRLQAAARLVISLEELGRMGGSSLTDLSLPVPAAGTGGPQQIPSTYVPFRNTIFAALGVAWAEALGAREVILGAVQSDRPGYPDCREEYFQALDVLVQAGTRPGSRIRVRAPLVRLGKGEIVRLGLRLGAPLELSWSCYLEGERACGACESCRQRLQGFREAGVEDPIPYLPRT